MSGRLQLTLWLCAALTVGCAEGFNPLLSDATLMGTATGGAAGQPPTGGQGGGLDPLDATIGPCAPGQVLGLCSVCGPDGLAMAPATDGQCPALTCPPGESIFVLEDEGNSSICYEVSPPAIPEPLCAQLGICAGQAEVCAQGERLAITNVVRGGCRGIAGCSGATPPQIEPANAGAICAIESQTEVQFVRIQSTSGRTDLGWSEIEIWGTIDGGPVENLALRAEVSASAGADTVGLAIDGDEGTAWDPSRRPPVQFTLDLRQRTQVTRLRLLVLQPVVGDTIHQVYYGDPSQTFGLAIAFEQETQTGDWLEYAPEGSCNENGICVEN